MLASATHPLSSLCFALSSSAIPRLLSSTLFPYTTLFRSFGSSREDVGFGIVADAAGNTVTSGWFQRTVDFGKGQVTSAGEKDALDRKSTRLNSSHVKISYAVFCLKKKKTERIAIGIETTA